MASTSGTKNEEGVEIVQFKDFNDSGGESDSFHDDSDTEIEEFDTEPEIDDNNGSENDEDDDFMPMNVPVLKFGTVSPDEGETCICKDFFDSKSCISGLESMSTVTPSFDNHYCIIDNLIRAYNIIFCEDIRGLHYTKVAFADLFYRIRHEILFKLLCLSFNISPDHSDVPFSDFGIDSNRTPDLIIEMQGILLILEITATSGIEKAAQSKGMQELGFESKYKKEIEQLEALGRTVLYLPIFFDMSNIHSPLNSELYITASSYFNVSSPYKILLTSVSKEFSILTSNFKNSLVLPSAVLFSKSLPISFKHPSYEFLYKKSDKEPRLPFYSEKTISMPVYSKISNDKIRLYKLLDNNNFTDNQKLIFVLSNIGHRVTLEPNNAFGVTLNDLRELLNSSDIVTLMKHVKIKSGNILLDTTDSETGVKFYERLISRPTKLINIEKIPTISNHTTQLFRHPFNFSTYKAKIETFVSQNMSSIHFDPNYEDLYIKMICEMDRSDMYSNMPIKGLLGDLRSDDIDIDLVFNNLENDYVDQNKENEQLPLIKLKMKPPFLMPLADLNCSSYTKLENKNIDFISHLWVELNQNNPYTSLILQNTILPNYNFYNKSKPPSSDYLSLVNKRSAISNEINSLQKELYRKGANDVDNVQLSKCTDTRYSVPFNKLKENFKIIQKEINFKKRTERIGEDISFIRLPTKNKNSNLRSLYDQEMSHFKDKKQQSTIEGVGIRSNLQHDYESDLEIFNNISELLCENRGKNPDSIIHDHVAKDVKLLNDLKKIALENYRNLMNQILESSLGHSTAFISRLAHSLMFYSQLSFNSDYVRVDNLGYKNCLLIVRGGKKIFKSKSSKLFRLIYPISEAILPWYEQGHRNKGSFRFLEFHGVNYAITPWAMFHESILTDAISFHSRVTSFVLLNLNPKLDLKQQFHKVSTNVLLSFHNRRKTEIILANLRYILLSTLGDFTGIVQILPEFFGFNYDCFQAFIRTSILYNYPKYFKQLDNLKQEKNDKNKVINMSDFVSLGLENIFTKMVISRVEDLTLMIYSTFLMTKAPYQKISERAKNLSGILEIHDLYSKEVGLGLTPERQTSNLSTSVIDPEHPEEYLKDLFKNDFKIDPKFNACVGNFIDSYYINLGCKDDLETSWLNIMNESWDEMATSTGLRGDYENVEDFWGQKGYFVVYKKLLSNNEYVNKMVKLFDVNLDHDDKRRLLRNLNETFVEKLDPEREFLIFHAVDKVQWRGSREIYVMDMMTKMMQQPIEKFMGVLCKKLDNELISIPSDRRSQVIHHSIFEKDVPLKEMLTWYLTLDCSKWAPKSVFTKFAIVILNMSTIPNSFKIHFMNYLEKLNKKRIYFNKPEVEALMNNQKYSTICKSYLIEDKKVKGYYLEMPYSWVMGIFNYTSSFLHAANQKYSSYLLMKTSMMSFKEETSLIMFAHSDDSGGRLNVSSVFMAKRAIILYEIMLKACNHLLSKKKSVISRIYFEILSIIYMFKKLLALLPKFLGGIRFLPSDKGPAQDMLQSYSKGIEVLIAGADFSVSYIVMKIYSYLTWRFYYNRDPIELDYERPVQYLGVPDAHPLMFLLVGSDSDIIRLMKTNVDLQSMITFINTMSKTMDQEGPVKSLKFEIKVKGIKKGFEDFIDLFGEQLESWSIRNVNYHSTPMNTLNFLRKLNDSGFVGSLVNESTTRRISRAYFLRSGESAITRLGNVKLHSILDSIVLFQNYNSKENAVRHIFNEILTPEQVDKLNEEFEENKGPAERGIKLLENTMKSPFKILKYLDMISMDGRKINESYRTLKPTHIQLVKSSKVFSTNFDPASLVSYLKEPEFRWALQSIRNLNISAIEAKNFCEAAKFDIDTIEPDLLLRLCRTYGKDNTKSIYLYSRVPGEIRQIKTYSGFLTFLSVNSFHDKEIAGLTLKLNDRDLAKEYVQSNITEEVYLVNNILSLLITLMPILKQDFLSTIVLKPIEEIEWLGGSIVELLDHVENIADTDVRYNMILPMLELLKHQLGLSNESSSVLNRMAYYTFLKSQRSRSGWVGKGEVYIRVENHFYSFVINNSNIESMYSNRQGKLPEHHSDFILDVFDHINIKANGMKKPSYKMFNQMVFGYDNTGNLSISKGREMDTGVQCIILSSRNEFVDKLENYSFHNLSGDCITLKTGFEGDISYKKVFILPVKKAELVNTIKLMFNPRDFEEKMIELGIGNFEEFIYTEILTEYGKEIYIGFQDLFDNYLGSRLYEIFKKTYDNNLSKINKAMNFSPLPASEGSLVRILIDYSRETGDIVVKVPMNLTPTMMQLRSEYPEQTTTLLGEKLHEYHKQIFTPSEIKEISDSYESISISEDLNVVRDSLIKLMTYWGYGSLVNSIQNFTLAREAKNYLFFNLNTAKSNSKQFSDLFIVTVKKMIKVMKNWRPYLKSIDVFSKQLYNFTDLDFYLENYVYYIVLGAYSYETLLLKPELYLAQFINILYGLLKEDDFNAELQESFRQDYILGSILISYKLRGELCSMLNVLHSCWLKENKIEFEIDYRIKNPRLPDNIPNFKNLLKQFDITISPVNAYYSGFLNDNIMSYILNKGEIEAGGNKYRLKNKLSRKSNITIPANNFLKFKRPLSYDLLNDGSLEDLFYELTMEDIDQEESQMLLEDLGDIYQPKITKAMKIKDKIIVRGTVNWLISPNISHKFSEVDNYRQVGENIVILTNSFLDLKKYFPYSGTRLIKPKKHWNVDGKPFLLTYILQKELYNKEFLDKFIGGVEYDFHQLDEQILNIDSIRDINGELKKSKNQGFVFDEQLLNSNRIVEEADGILKLKKVEDGIDEDQPEYNSLNEIPLTLEEIKFKKVSEKLAELEKSRMIDPESLKHLNQKYLIKAVKDGLSQTMILNSLIREFDLISINNETLSHASNTSAENQKKMFLSPTYFSLNYGVNRSNIRPIKDKKVRSELNSFHEGMADSIGSNTLKISNKFKKLILANFKMWNRMVNFGDYKKENKKFLLSVFISICNNTFVSDDETHDHRWQEVVNKTTLYISDDGPESEDLEGELSGLLFNLNPASRIRYRSEGL